MPLPSGSTSAPIPAIPWTQCHAKTAGDGSPGATVLEHCCNVAEVARALVDLLPDHVVSLLGGNPVTVAAMHDVGKVSPGYQWKYFAAALERSCPELAALGSAGYEQRHALISELALDSYLSAEPTRAVSCAALAEVVGAHHGSRAEMALVSEGAEVLGSEAWAAQRWALIEHLEQHYGPVQSNPPPDLEVLAGLTCVADWIGSDEQHFPPEGLSDVQDPTAVARSAVTACGWRKVGLRAGLSFADVFGFEPYPAQRAFYEAVTRPGLYVLEAPMGQGKTEAALFAAYRLMALGHSSGLYFGLPTRLTSDRIHWRVDNFLRRVAQDSPGVKLAHGTAWLKAFEHGGEDLAPGSAWFRPSKRSLLLPFAVGTIDQALLAVLKVRHHFVRTFGLAGKVVILDEVHSYDMYTGTLLDLLVRRLREVGCTVIVLSATLTRQRRAQLLPRRPEEGSSDAYPLITCQTPGHTRELQPPSGERGKRDVRLTVGPLSEPEVAGVAVQEATLGRCVMCIANTVARAQRWYNEVKAVMTSGAFEVGLLHSKFPARRRGELEDLWVARLGKDGERPDGAVLVATQVVEQSVDMDADFMMTELAPMDMILQRAGRLWRHEREDRPREHPELVVVGQGGEEAQSLDELEEALGKANSRVYSSYVLWRTHHLLRNVTTLRIPADIRGLLECTYADVRNGLPPAAAEALRQMQRRRYRLRRLAGAARAGTTGFCTMRDDENAATRHSDFPTSDVRLVQELQSTGNSGLLMLCDGKQVQVERHEWTPTAARLLLQNTVSVPAYRLPGSRTPDLLQRYFHAPTPVLVLGPSGELSQDGRPTGLAYDDERGLRTDDRDGKKTAARARRGDDDEPREEWNELDTWNGDLDELVW